MTIRSILFLSFSLISTLFTFSQSFIKGTITDRKSGEPLTGAAVQIEGTTLGTTADIDGNYEIKVKPGTYNLLVSYVSYKPQKKTGLIVTQDNPTVFNIEMDEVSLELESVQVFARAKTDTDLSLLRNVRSALQVVSGISSQQISKTLDRDASEVVKRVPGVTIQDNRFIVVRGLNQRYNQVWLNNAATPSSETDVKAFSFDAIPSNMIDNLLIFKTGSAENAAEATGGFIKISTKNIPDENFVNLDYSLGYNEETTFKEANLLPFHWSDLAGMGFIGRNLPAGFPNNLTKLSVSQRDMYALQLSSNWTPQPVISLPNQKISVSWGNKWNLSEGRKLGTISSVSYSNNYSSRYNTTNNMYEKVEETTGTPVYLYQYNGNVYSRDFRIGIMHNWSYQLANGTRFEFRNLLNQIGIDKSADNAGWNNYRQANFKYYSNQYSARTTYSTQFSGLHKLFNKEDQKLDWNLGFSYANRIEPDRQNRSEKEVSSGVYQYIIPDIGSINELGRLYMKNHEYVAIALLNWENKYKIDEFNITLKAGTYNELKTRNFAERSLTYKNAYGSLSYNEINQITFNDLFTQNYLGTGKVISIDEQTNIANNYQAQNMLSALYLSSSITKGALNANAGIRAEFNRLMLQGYYNASSPVNVDEPNLNVFPSVNIAYNITEKQILRLAYSGSINRPEFREIAPLTYYDFTEKNSVVGNPDLKDAIIQNLDLRYEIYPSPGETFTLAAFYKNFKNPIEMVSIGAGSLFSFDNADGAENFGLELELKKNLGFIGLKNFNLNLNTSFIYSQVLFEDQQSERNRALQGQSPYVVNAGIYYQNDEKGISSTLMYNVMGKRILVAAQINQGKVEVPDIYEMPRNVIDFSFNKKINSRMEIKFGIKDILSQNHRTMQNYEYISGGETKNILLTNRLYNTGRTWSLGINYKL